MVNRAASPTKKARHASPSPPSTPPRQIKKLVFPRQDHDNPFIDDAAVQSEDDQGEDKAYETKTLKDVIAKYVVTLLHYQHFVMPSLQNRRVRGVRTCCSSRSLRTAQRRRQVVPRHVPVLAQAEVRSYDSLQFFPAETLRRACIWTPDGSSDIGHMDLSREMGDLGHKDTMAIRYVCTFAHARYRTHTSYVGEWQRPLPLSTLEERRTLVLSPPSYSRFTETSLSTRVPLSGKPLLPLALSTPRSSIAPKSVSIHRH